MFSRLKSQAQWIKRTEHLIELTGNVYLIIQKYPHRQVVLHSLTNVYHGV